MEIMDAWTKFFQTGNVLDYLKYSAIRDAQNQAGTNNKEQSESNRDNQPSTFSNSGIKS